jgi:diguanylate cyclase (GGDEF)-like protein
MLRNLKSALEADFERVELGTGALSFWEGAQDAPSIKHAPWRVLVADDEEDAREAARMALSGIELSGRPLELLFAHSAVQAWDMLEDDPSVAVLLLDVVMESPTAGLDLVKRLRGFQRHEALRIILRTGQPGYAPELDVAKQYDINDYKAKNELTQSKLVASLASALRSHAQIIALQWQTERLGLMARATVGILAKCDDAFAAAREAVAMAEQALGPGSLAACAASSGRREWLVATSGLEEAQDGMILADVAKLGPDCARAAEELSVALASGLAGAASGSMAKLINSGSTRVALWWEPPPLAPRKAAVAVFEAYCASVSAALESCSQKDLARRAAYWDELTELPNRAWLMERVDQASPHTLDGLGLLFVDLIGFSEVNDALGYDAGDGLLKESARALAGAFPGCEVARMPGGAFAVMGEWDELDAEEAVKAFDAPLSTIGWEVQARVHMGKARLGARKPARQALNEANMALNALKGDRAVAGACRVHDDELDRVARERHKMAKDLKKALRVAGGLSLYYQPQIDFVTGRAVGVEALARWRLPDGTMVPPSRFVQVAEACGLVGELGDWALSEACRQAVAWRAMGIELPIAVNVSPLQIDSAGVFLDKLAASLDASACEPSWIELEITEAAAMRDPGQARDAIAEARKWGCRASLDDFGTGFSSLGRLADWPLDKLKMDRSLVAPIVEDPRARSIARMVMSLGQELGLEVIAEGVETKEQRVELMKMGARLAQGWLYCPALPEQDVIKACAKGFL